MTRNIFFLSTLMAVVTLSLPVISFSQYALPPDQPEQDACHALTLCGGKFSVPYSYQGTGLVADLTQTPCSGIGEYNSMWIKVTIASAGILAFRIIPVDSFVDYDFAVLDVSGTDCSNLSPSNVVRCNYNNNIPGYNPMGIVGLSDTGTIPYVQGASFGNPFCEAINATAGQTYLILIDDFGRNLEPRVTSGFTIDFSTSTAGFQDNSPPAFSNMVRQCSDSTIGVQLTEPVLCSSIAADGSDFYITPSVMVAGAAGVNCVNNSGYTSQIVITLSGNIPPGDYTLNVRKGTDGNALLNLCGDAIAVPNAISFVVPPLMKYAFIPADTFKCDYSPIFISADKPFESYLWSSGQTTRGIEVTNPGLYTLQVVDTDGCGVTDSITIRDSACPEYVYFPSAFTPNRGGRNDIFRPVFAGVVGEFRFVIYDRWGRQVFQTSVPGEGWDGTTGGVQQPLGTYVWFCSYRLYQQPQRQHKGTVMLIR